jgi:hypothetical protein
MTDFNTSDRDVNRAIRSWLHEDRHEDISRVAGAVLDLLDTTPQRRSPWWPARRIPFMNKPLSLGLGAAAVVAALVIGAQVLGPPAPGNVGGVPSASPTLTPAPTATTEPSPSPASAPPLTQTFTSTQHGISLSYPEGWIAKVATEPWTDAGVRFDESYRDFLYDPILTDHLFLSMASQPIGDATPEKWMAAQIASNGCSPGEPIEIDGAAGLIGSEGCDEEVAAVTIGGRGYEIHLLTSDDDPAAVAPYDRAWFEDVLATVRLHPEDAVD